ncbi:MAG: hypothetical protein ACKOPS_25615 [Cyanobium sp.]
MTASPTLSSSPSQASAPALGLTWHNEALRQRVEAAAAHAGLSAAEICEQWLLQGLEEAEHQRALNEAGGRCSLRTGTCTAGPVPLPVQQ